MAKDWEKADAFDISPDMQPEQLRQATVEYAQSHSNWYAIRSETMKASWNYVTFATIVLSASSSVISAYNDDLKLRWIPALLAALATFCAAYLSQFRVRDLWEIREKGRIDAERLVAKAQLIGISKENPAFAQAIALRNELHDLELDQTQQFFVDAKNPKK
ncbi:DUF4231 domain-containing protein [Rhizobium ruizarguesonis]|uniref:DUF4231 domain-containing protein n=1 Tax=Rhizobium ruizarguesonis TaxID=2081791 RepID=UPI00102F9AF5|nr:DUF4231 domain-containing protein [Rhizobium ruizarguesonis]TBA65356.1 DUF4231 domain-containing protein [Rhizobium ruizarguesonis]